MSIRSLQQGGTFVLVLLGFLMLTPRAGAQYGDSAGGATGGAGGGDSSGGPATDGLSIGWGTIWYIKGVDGTDDATWTQGGADGSSVLLLKFPEDGYTQWVLLEGRSLHLGPRGGPLRTFAATPGKAVISRRYGRNDGRVVSADMRYVTEQLIELRRRGQVLHAPFLIGKGWDLGNDANEASGARFAEADRVADLLGVRLKVLPNHSGGSREGVVEFQDPAGGAPLRPGDTLRVRFTGTAPPAAATLDGDTPANPIVVAFTDNRYQRRLAVSTDYTDDPTLRPCRLNGLDVFWELPAAANGKTVVIRRRSAGDPPFTLSAWTGASGPTDPVLDNSGSPLCDWVTPEIQLEIPKAAAGKYYVMADLPPGLPSGRISIHMEILEP